MYSYHEVLEASTKYFNQDELAARVFVDKYALRDNEDNILEKTPEDMHRRLAKEFARIEKKKFKKPLSEEDIFNLFDRFKRIIPQGSPMYGIGNPYQYVSYGNCFVLPSPLDSYLGIMYTDTQITQISSKRGGVGWDISNLRPDGMSVRNAAKTTTGVTSFMKRFSNTIREVGQCICVGQKVLSKKGLTNIEDIEIGDKVWTKNGWVKVQNVIANGVKPIYKLTTNFGYEIKTSKEHVFLNNSMEEVKLEDCEAGDFIVLIPGNTERRSTDYVKLQPSTEKKLHGNVVERFLPTILEEKFAYLLGFAYGNGCINGSLFSLSCSHDYPLIQQKLIDTIKKIFDYEAKIHKGDGAVNVVNIHSTYIVRWLKENGIAKGKCDNLNFPDKILNSPISVQAAFCSGYFDADGSAKNVRKGYSVTSVDYDFIRQYQNLLMSFGIVTKLHFTKSQILNWKDKWSVTIVGKYSQKISQIILSESLKITSCGVLAKKDNHLTPYTLDILGLKKNQVKYCSNKAQFVSANCLNRLKQDKITDLNLLIQDTIISVEYVGDEETYDLELESEHLFYCEGFYVHNSGRRGASLQSIQVNHPQILDFIKVKQDLTQVTGSNISVKFTDDFLKAVEEDRDFELKWPVDSNSPKVSKTVKAKDIWKEFIHSAWLMAEPGAMYWDTVINRSTTSPYKKFGFIEVSSNPCVIEGTLVDTPYGQIPVENIKVGDLINVYGGGCEKVGSIEVNCNMPTFEVVFSNGVKQYVTESHRYFKVNKYNRGIPTQLRDLSINDEILIDDNEYKTTISEINAYKIATVYDLHCPGSDTWVTSKIVQQGCGEQFLPPFASCRLILQNLYTYVKNKFTKDAYFDYEEFAKDAALMQRLGDDMVDLELEAVDRIINKIKSDKEPPEVKEIGVKLWENIKQCAINDRRTGCGFTALADCIAGLNMKFDSDEALSFIDKMVETFKVATFTSSIDMSKELGTFPLYDSKLDINSKFIQEMKNEHPELYNRMVKYGRRNMTLLTVAPAGSVSCETQTSSGLEPVFMLEYMRRKKGNPGDKDFRVDFVDQNKDHWMEFVVRHKGLQDWMNVTGDSDITKSPYYGSTAHDINWVKKVKMQGIIQRAIDNSISVTVNLPNDVTEEQVSEIYLTAWKTGCKGMTIYRDGSRTGVLVSNEEKEDEIDLSERPKVLDCNIHHISIKGVRYCAIVGLLNEKPYEIFIMRNCDVEGDALISKSLTAGKLEKIKKSHYNVMDGLEVVYKIVSTNCDEHEEMMARLTSASLRHGADISFIVHQLEKTRGDMQSFSKVIARTLKRYIKDGTEVKGEECENCKGKLVRMEGCITCVNCGWSKC